MQSDVQSSVTTTRRDGGSVSLTDDAALVAALRMIVGKSHVITGAERTRRFCTGFRFGHGPAVAVVRPGSLVEQWRGLKACVAANKIVIMQAAASILDAPLRDLSDTGTVIRQSHRSSCALSPR